MININKEIETKEEAEEQVKLCKTWIAELFNRDMNDTTLYQTVTQNGLPLKVKLMPDYSNVSLLKLTEHYDIGVGVFKQIGRESYLSSVFLMYHYIDTENYIDIEVINDREATAYIHHFIDQERFSELIDCLFKWQSHDYCVDAELEKIIERKKRGSISQKKNNIVSNRCYIK